MSIKKLDVSYFPIMLARALRENIVKISRAKNLSYAQLEKDAGLHKNYISNLLADDEKFPRIDAVIKIADTLKVNIDDLVGYEHEVHLEPKLMQSCIAEVMQILTRKNKDLTLSRFWFLVKSVYLYCWGKKSKTVDTEFAKWFVEHSL